MAFLSAVLAGLALAAGPPQASITLDAAPSIVRADGHVVAALVPGDDGSRCAHVVLWRLGHAPVSVDTRAQCGGGDRVDDMALAGTTVAWEVVGGGNTQELVISKARLDRPAPVGVSYAASTAGERDGDHTGDLAGHGGLLVYASWTECYPAHWPDPSTKPCDGGPRITEQKVKRIGGGVLRRGADALHPVWVDSGRVLIRHADRSLLLLDGPVTRRFPKAPGLLGAAIQGRQLVTLTRTALAVYDTETGRRTRSIRLPAAVRALRDVQDGIAVLGRSGTAHLIRLSDGKGAAFRGAANAQLEPAGLYYSTGRRLVFVPRAAVLRRFG